LNLQNIKIKYWSYQHYVLCALGAGFPVIWALVRLVKLITGKISLPFFLIKTGTASPTFCFLHESSSRANQTVPFFQTNGMQRLQISSFAFPRLLKQENCIPLFFAPRRGRAANNPVLIFLALNTNENRRCCPQCFWLSNNSNSTPRGTTPLFFKESYV
jgi:hypothetical protein